MRAEKMLYAGLILLCFWPMPIPTCAQSTPHQLKVDYLKQIRIESSSINSKFDRDNDVEFLQDWQRSITSIWSDSKYRSDVRYLKSIVSLANDGVPNGIRIVGALNSGAINLATVVLNQSRAKRCFQSAAGKGHRYLISFRDYPEVRIEHYIELGGN